MTRITFANSFVLANPNCDHWKTDCLKAHNDYRAKHDGTGDLTWSDTLAWEAQAWANHIATTGKPAHCPAKKRAGQGENLACAKGEYTLDNQIFTTVS